MESLLYLSHLKCLVVRSPGSTSHEDSSWAGGWGRGTKSCRSALVALSLSEASTNPSAQKNDSAHCLSGGFVGFRRYHGVPKFEDHVKKRSERPGRKTGLSSQKHVKIALYVIIINSSFHFLSRSINITIFFK